MLGRVIQTFRREDPDDLPALWQTMDAEKGDLIHRSEEYARWTIPYICPPENSEGREQEKGDVAIGPRLVNHLSNKVVDAMFPHGRPFFTIAMTPELKEELREEFEGQEAEFAEAVRERTTAVEEMAVRKLSLSTYRTKAVEAVKHQIIAGNAVIRRMEDGRRVVYGVKNFCIRRDADGTPKHIMLRDIKMFAGLDPEIQEQVREVEPDINDVAECYLYTEIKRVGSRWRYRQAVNKHLLDNARSFTDTDLPVIPLVWNLSRGENYGRGLVEDHTTAFHHVDVMTQSMVDMVDVMSDIKFLVDPGSVLDPGELNASRRGSYHQGRDGDVTIPEFSRQMAVGEIRQIIADLERELAQAFLLNSSTVRDAERVTAEEIRYIAMELESAFGGLYSRLATEWQQREAEYAVSLIDTSLQMGGSGSDFEVIITTGLESLSREGLLENLRRAISDMQLLEAVPQEVRDTINPRKFASFVFNNHTVPFREFLFSDEEIAQRNEERMRMAGREAEMQADANVREEAGKKAVQES